MLKSSERTANDNKQGDLSTKIKCTHYSEWKIYLSGEGRLTLSHVFIFKKKLSAGVRWKILVTY